MAFDAGDLETSFEAAGLFGLTVTRRHLGTKWFAHASYDAKDWTKRKVVSVEDNSLERALVRLLKMAPRHPQPVEPPTDYLEDLL